MILVENTELWANSKIFIRLSLERFSLLHFTAIHTWCYNKVYLIRGLSTPAPIPELQDISLTPFGLTMPAGMVEKRVWNIWTSYCRRIQAIDTKRRLKVRSKNIICISHRMFYYSGNTKRSDPVLIDVCFPESYQSLRFLVHFLMLG